MTRQYFFRFVFSLAALAVLGAYVFGPEVLAKRFDTMALGLLGLAALPWLGALVEEFKIGGVEAKLRAIREEVAEAGDAASEAREVAEELALTQRIPKNYETPSAQNFSAAPEDPKSEKDYIERSRPPRVDIQYAPDAERQESKEILPEDFFDQPAPEDDATEKSAPINPEENDPFFIAARPTISPADDDRLGQLKEIARYYVQVRKKMPSGTARTAQMTSLFAEMQAAAGKLGGDSEEMHQWLRSDESGKQLAAISWLRSFPAAVPPAIYVDVIERAKQPFVQYWALRALSGRLSALGLDEFSIADRVALKEFESLMRAGTDRHAQIRRINRKLSGRTPL